VENIKVSSIIINIVVTLVVTVFGGILVFKYTKNYQTIDSKSKMIWDYCKLAFLIVTPLVAYFYVMKSNIDINMKLYLFSLIWLTIVGFLFFATHIILKRLIKYASMIDEVVNTVSGIEKKIENITKDKQLQDDVLSLTKKTDELGKFVVRRLKNYDETISSIEQNNYSSTGILNGKILDISNKLSIIAKELEKVDKQKEVKDFLVTNDKKPSSSIKGRYVMQNGRFVYVEDNNNIL
jgi:hypothetical protein